MKKTVSPRWLGAFVLMFTLMPFLASAQGQSPKADPAAQKLCDKMLDAIKSADRDAFIANVTDTVKERTTPEVMEALKKELGVRLTKGFQQNYLCELKQSGHLVHMWKLTFKDGGDDLVIRLAIKDGKVGGFFFN